MMAILRDRRFEPGFSFLFDRSRVPEAPSAEFMRQVWEFAQEHWHALESSRAAVVVADLASMVSIRTNFDGMDPVRRRVFANQALARAWLRDSHKGWVDAG